MPRKMSKRVKYVVFLAFGHVKSYRCKQKARGGTGQRTIDGMGRKLNMFVVHSPIARSREAFFVSEGSLFYASVHKFVE